jgi:prepilin signal peptidase PulO-like enzyme (type II secretory pathway)
MSEIHFLILIPIFLFGIIIGSFLNVLVLRKGTGLNLGGRSMCFSCGKTLSFFELVPVLSFLIQSGKCKGCKSRISWQYPLVELVSGIVFVLMAYIWLIPFNFSIYSLGAFTFKTSAVLALLSLSAYDWKHKIIPDSFSAWFSLSALFSIAWDYSFKMGIGGSVINEFLPYTAVWFIVTGLIFFCIFGLVWVISQGKWLGFGDVKLVLGIGFLLGPIEGVSAIVFAFWIGAIYSIGHIIVSKIRVYKGNVALSHEIPFAPFLALGTFVAVLSHIDLFQIGNILAIFYG